MGQAQSNEEAEEQKQQSIKFNEIAQSELFKSVNKQNFIGTSSKNITNTFTFGKILGKGAYGEVILATQKGTHFERAIKQIHKYRIVDINDDIMSEFMVLKDLDHPYIMKVKP